MDDLVDAFSKAEIANQTNKPQDVVPEQHQNKEEGLLSNSTEILVKKEDEESISQSRDVFHQVMSDRNDVDVYIAPEVLGHRWVRSRSTAYIVERPERLRASLLGLAAVIGKAHDRWRNRESVKSEGNVQSLNEEMASISMLQSSSSLNMNKDVGPFQAIISHSKVPLNSPNEGLKAIHALEEEILTLEEIGEAPAYSVATKAAQQAELASEPLKSELHLNSSENVEWLQTQNSYLSLLHRLCRMAPSREPEVVLPVRTLRQNASPTKVDNGNAGTRQADTTSSFLLQDGSFPSEIPTNLPQGDLYLCGQALLSRKAHHVTQLSTESAKLKEQNSDPSTPQEEAGPFLTETSSQPAPFTPPHKDQHDTESKALDVQSTIQSPSVDLPSEAQLLSQGSQGAIEASLGACCTALRRIMLGANKSNYSQQSESTIQDDLISVNLSNLHIPLPSSSTKSTSSSRKSSHWPKSVGRRAFVLARPPGHHCSATKPSGFCWVNNVAVMAAEAYETYGVDRIAVLDFDLHHGDGTQSIVWRINEQCVRIDADREARKNAILAEEKAKGKKTKNYASHLKFSSNPLPANLEVGQQDEIGQPSTLSTVTHEDRWTKLLGKRGLKMFYGSLHDIESFPCEDGDKQKVTDASVKIEGGHGQWIWNVHLESHSNREGFFSAYQTKYKQLIQKAREFFEKTDSLPDSSMIIISAGFDACIHETPGMQRHGKNVPPEFYTIFTRDAVQLAEQLCKGKLISVLEGGYSDRALITGVISHLVGLTGDLEDGFAEELCSTSVLSQIDRLSKMASNSMTSIKKEDERIQNKPASEIIASPSVSISRKRSEWSIKDPIWLKATLETFKRLQEHCGNQRKTDLNGSSTAPTTPKTDGIIDSLWRSPRELRSSKILDTM